VKSRSVDAALLQPSQALHTHPKTKVDWETLTAHLQEGRRGALSPPAKPRKTGRYDHT